MCVTLRHKGKHRGFRFRFRFRFRVWVEVLGLGFRVWVVLGVRFSFRV
jgi:hypothetical protein